MVLLQLVGQGAFILASLALGIRLLLLWRRTHELPELTLGLSFVLGGGLGYIAWFVLGAVMMKGGSPVLMHAIAAFGLAVSCLGAVLNGIGIARIFRADMRWPLLGVACIAVAMLVFWVAYWRTGGMGSLAFWGGIGVSLPIYAWGSAETLTLGRALHRRALLGLADPIVVNRLVQWGLSGIATVAMIVLPLVSRWLHGPVPPAWTSVVSACLGLVAATTIWLGFFPPQSLRARLARAYAE